MLGLSLPEIIFLAILALVVIGPKQLPEVARTLGRILNELRRASFSLTEELKQQVKIDPIRLEEHPTDPAAGKDQTTGTSPSPDLSPSTENSDSSGVKKS